MRPLGYFTAKAYAECFPEALNHELPFNDKLAEDRVLLTTRGVNRILIYPGSFNPPHKGHWKLLNHVFHNAGADLQIVAAIIIPTSDRRVAVKNYKKSEDLIIPRHQRVQLWKEAKVLSGRIWVFDREEDDWVFFRTLLENKLCEAKVRVKFVVLAGPDHVRKSTTTDPTYWNCPDTITSDICRPVDFVTARGNLHMVYPCSEWIRPRWDKAKLSSMFREHLQGQPNKYIEDAVAEASEQMRHVWVCHRLVKPKGYIRFIWTGQSVPTYEVPSSTELRQLLQRPCTADSRQRVASTALSPSLLVKIVKMYIPSPELQKMQAELRERAATEAERDWRDKIAW